MTASAPRLMPGSAPLPLDAVHVRPRALAGRQLALDTIALAHALYLRREPAFDRPSWSGPTATSMPIARTCAAIPVAVSYAESTAARNSAIA